MVWDIHMNATKVWIYISVIQHFVVFRHTEKVGRKIKSVSAPRTVHIAGARFVKFEANQHLVKANGHFWLCVVSWCNTLPGFQPLYDISIGCVALLFHFQTWRKHLSLFMHLSSSRAPFILRRTAFLWRKLKREFFTLSFWKTLLWPGLPVLFAISSRWECQHRGFLFTALRMTHQTYCGSKIFQAWQMAFTWIYWVIIQKSKWQCY